MSAPNDNAPTSFDAARRWTASRVNVLNKMSSRELALSPAFGPEAKTRAFFSAKVAQAHILDRLREVSDDFSSGKTNLAEARTRLKAFLSGRGYSPDNVAAGKNEDRNNSLSNLASTARIDLILNQNARMAAAVAAREVSMDPDILERWPYFRYVPSRSKNKREAHQAFYNLVLRKDDPFWRTHTPPLDFNCKCSLEDADQDDADAAGGSAEAVEIEGSEANRWAIKLPNGQALQVDTPASGYVFDVGAALDSCDMSLIKHIPTRRQVLQDLRQYAGTAKAPVKIIAKGETSVPAVTGGASPQELDAFLAKAQAVNRLTKKAGYEMLSLGSLSQEMMDAIGIVGKNEMTLVLSHTVDHHYDELLNGDIPKILAETLGSPGATASMTLKSNTAVLTLAVKSKDNPGKDAIAVFQLEDEKDWRKWKLLSVHYDDPGYMDSKRIMTK
jgi:hypothetical protein